MKKFLTTLFVLVSVVSISLAKSPVSVKAQIIEDAKSEMVYLKVSKLTTNKETIKLCFKDEAGKIIKTVKVATEHYTTVKKLNLGHLDASKVSVEIVPSAF